MKKILIACICIPFAAALTGCSAGTILNQFVSVGDTPAQETVPGSKRVYMDEVHGILKDFNGSRLTLLDDPDTYIFDVSQATLECEGGMITGDEISVIYEGQLTGTDTDTVRVLKVVDEYHKKKQLENKTTYGQIQNLTANTITLKSRTGRVATYPITGTEQYYQNGVRSGAWVYLHYKGSFGESGTNDPTVLNASHLKVLSVSDIDPLKVPSPTPTPVPAESQETEREKKFTAVIQNIQLNSLQINPINSDISLNVNLNSIPSYFSGGAAPGSRVTVTYTGDFNGETLEGVTILGITGEMPENTKERDISFTVTGEITASTANTITLLTSDGISITCRTDKADNTTTGGLLTGSSVKITFNPADSRESNIYTCLKIEDA